MKLEQLQGKTVAEIEREMDWQTPTGRNKKPLLWLILGLVVVLCLLYTIWCQHRELGRLQALNDALTVENNALVVENDLWQQKANQPAVSPVPQEEQEQGPLALPQSDRYIYYEVKPHDSLSKISFLFFNHYDYAKELAQANGLTKGAILRVGQVIKVPKDLTSQGE